MCSTSSSGEGGKMESSSGTLDHLLYAPRCVGWKSSMEAGLFQLGSLILLLAFMGGSGVLGCIYVFALMAIGFLCMVLWGGLWVCGVDVVVWNVLLMVACLVQIIHLIYRLRRESYGEDYDTLYRTVYQPLQVPLPIFKEIAHCSGMEVHTLNADQSYALEGKTPIDRLSLLISGRVKVSLDGQFLHYIFPYQFLDSPEWESLRPSEEGTFQVTLTAETDSTFISWPRKKLYLLLAREKYISRLFSVLLGFDICHKLYALNDKLFAKFGLRFDIRLPSLYHVLGPSSEPAGDIVAVTDHSQAAPALHKAPASHPQQPAGIRGSRPESGHLACSVLQRGHPRLLPHGRAPLAPTQTPEL
ncbi:popeye domain-containing protein 2 isoform 2-T2 [Leptodactylus fuscus]|uniref:popeye domain-containing protein 2 isoform X2 n=1 Tax=Leptodactylus fuscus TaxID=238119 RepID=UPI003F4EFF2C